MILQEIIDQLRLCGYKCEAGPLENNVAFQELERLAREAEAEQARIFTGNQIFERFKESPYWKTNNRLSIYRLVAILEQLPITHLVTGIDFIEIRTSRPLKKPEVHILELLKPDSIRQDDQWLILRWD